MRRLAVVMIYGKINSIELGILSPSAFAVLRLMNNSKFVGCSTGRSPGLASGLVA